MKKANRLKTANLPLLKVRFGALIEALPLRAKPCPDYMREHSDIMEKTLEDVIRAGRLTSAQIRITVVRFASACETLESAMELHLYMVKHPCKKITMRHYVLLRKLNSFFLHAVRNGAMLIPKDEALQCEK